MTPPSWIDRKSEYDQWLRQYCRVVQLVTKQSRFWKLVAVGMACVSLGRFSRLRFLEDFATTLGPIQAYPHQWTSLSRRLLVHEARHTQQFLFAGWFVPVLGWLGAPVRVWVGLLPMALVYGLFPLPMFFAWGRFRLELDAEAAAWRVGLSEGWLSPAEVRQRADDFGKMVASWAYLKSWPERWSVAAFQRRAEMEIQRAAGGVEQKDRGNASRNSAG